MFRLAIKAIMTGAIVLVLPLSAALADGDLKKGKRVFNKCKACHIVNKEKNKVGPHLVGLFGRKAGTLKGYKYSKAMKKSDIVWNEETLDGYLTKPRKYLKGTKMTFAGLKKKKDRDNVIAYLKSVTGK